MEALGSAAVAGLLGFAGAKALGVDRAITTFNLLGMSLQPSMAYGAQIAVSSLAVEIANQYLPAWKDMQWANAVVAPLAVGGTSYALLMLTNPAQVSSHGFKMAGVGAVSYVGGQYIYDKYVLGQEI